MRIESVEKGSVITVWIVIGLAMTGFSGLYLWQGLRKLQPGFANVVHALYSAVPLVVLFCLGLLILAGCAWTLFDRFRNTLWLDIEAPVLRGETLGATVSSSRALAVREGLQLTADLACMRRELRSVEKVINGQALHETQVNEVPVWRAKEAVALGVGEYSCRVQFEIPRDALPTDPAAAAILSAAPGIYWVLTIELPGAGAPLRSYRIPVEPTPA